MSALLEQKTQAYDSLVQQQVLREAVQAEAQQKVVELESKLTNAEAMLQSQIEAAKVAQTELHSY